MKKVLVLGTLILLAGCTTENLQKVQAQTLKACGYLPTAQVIADIVLKKKLTKVEQVATAICNAVEK